MIKVLPFMFPTCLGPAALVTVVPACLFLAVRLDQFCSEDRRRATDKMISRRPCHLIVDVQLSVTHGNHLKQSAGVIGIIGVLLVMWRMLSVRISKPSSLVIEYSKQRPYECISILS